MTVRKYERRLFAGAVVTNQTGEILLVRLRRARPDAEPGAEPLWTLPWVEAEEWETADQAAARAVRRRAGLLVNPRELAFIIEWREDGGETDPHAPSIFALFIFRVEVEGALIDHRRDPEVLEVRWADAEWTALLSSPAIRKALEWWVLSGTPTYHRVTAGATRRRSADDGGF